MSKIEVKFARNLFSKKKKNIYGVRAWEIARLHFNKGFKRFCLTAFLATPAVGKNGTENPQMYINFISILRLAIV